MRHLFKDIITHCVNNSSPHLMQITPNKTMNQALFVTSQSSGESRVFYAGETRTKSPKPFFLKRYFYFA